jgi:hypothetical protein
MMIRLSLYDGKQKTVVCCEDLAGSTTPQSLKPPLVLIGKPNRHYAALKQEKNI